MTKHLLEKNLILLKIFADPSSSSYVNGDAKSYLNSKEIL